MKKLGVALLLTGVLISPAQAETVTYLHTDLLGSVVLETDQNRNVVQRYEYEPYGLPRQAIADAPGYTGHVHDAGSGLVYMQQRYYDPEVGRFLSVDPVGVDTGTGGNFNRYWYGNNNPYTFTDPDGREVVAYYANDNRSLFMVDQDTRAWALAEAESGGRPFGAPVPSGSYSILERAGRDGFYRLESRDAEFGDDATPDGRTNLRLHGPGRTVGCVSVCTNEGFAEIRDLLDSTITGQESVQDKSVLGRLLGREETLTSYGSMHVLSSGQTLKFDAKSGKISIETTRTGSRIPDRQVICTVQKDGGCK